MKQFVKFKGIAVAAILFAAASGCGSDDEEEKATGSNIVQTAQSQASLSTLVAAIQAAELESTLSTTQNLTVFAPTNAAFDALPDGAVKDIVGKVAAGTELSADEKTALSAVLTYHVVNASAAISSSDVTANTTQESLNGSEKIYFVPDTAAGTLTLNGGASVDANLRDVAASNGIVHVIDAVLIPDAYSTLVGALQKRYSHTTLVAAVTAADIGNTVATTSNLTLFAPSNDAFAALGDGAVKDIVTKVGAGTALSDSEKTALTAVLTYHVIDGSAAIKSSDVTANTSQESLNSNEKLFFVPDTSAGTLTINGEAKVDSAYRDIAASNGILHVTDKVLIPDAYLSVVSALQKRYDHTTLVAAVVAAELTTTLSGTGPFTIFAPTNAAFSATTGAVKDIVDKVGAGTTLSASEKTTLQNLIKFHGLGSEVKAASVPSSSSETLYTGNSITTTSASSGSVTVKGAGNSAAIAVSEADVDVSNGVIHVIGTVLAF